MAAGTAKDRALRLIGMVQRGTASYAQAEAGLYRAIAEAETNATEPLRRVLITVETYLDGVDHSGTCNGQSDEDCPRCGLNGLISKIEEVLATHG